MAITPTYSIGFSVAQGSRSGSISVTLTTDLVGLGIDPSDVEVAYGVSGPSGLLRQGGVFGVGGNIHPDVSYTGTIPLPLDITGTQVLEGIYTVDIVMRVVGAVEPGDWRAGPTQSELCTSCIPELCLDVQVDCLRAQVTATDTTAWTQSGWTVSRLLTLKYPGGFSHADITSTSSIVGTGSDPIPSRGTWTAIAEVTATKGALTVTITNTREFESNCSVNTCELACIIRNAWEKWQANKTPSNKEAWLNTINYASMIMNVIRCGTDNHALNEYATGLRAELGIMSSKGCGCNDCSEPMVPLLPVSQSQVWTAGYGIDITGDVISINTTVQAILNSFRLEEVVSTDGSIIWTSSTVGNTKTFDGSVANPATDSISFKYHWNLRTLVDSMSTPVIVGTTFQAPSLTYNGPSGIWPRVYNFDTVGTTPYRVDVYCVPVADPIIGSPNALDYTIPMEVKVHYQTNNSFTLGLVNNSSVLGNIGAEENRATWAIFVREVDIYITITKI